MSHPVRSIILGGARAALGVASVTLLAGMAACGSAPPAATPTATTRPSTPTAAPTPGLTALFQNSLATNPDITQWIDSQAQVCSFAGAAS